MVTNDGNKTLDILDVTRVSGSNEFTIVYEPTIVNPFTASHIGIRYTPTNTGYDTATFNIVSDDIYSPVITFIVSGTGI